MELVHGPPDDALAAMGSNYINMVSSLARTAEAETNQWLRTPGHITTVRRAELIGDFTSLLNRAAGCSWGCSSTPAHRTNHEMESLAANNVAAANAAILLIWTGYYDDAITRIRSISERVNLYALFLTSEPHFHTWMRTKPEGRYKTFGPGKVRALVNRLSDHDAPYPDDYYNLLCSRGVHPGSTAQHYTPGRTNGYNYGKFQELGLMVCIDELALAMGYAARFGIDILTHLDLALREEVGGHVSKLRDELIAFDDLTLLDELDNKLAARDASA